MKPIILYQLPGSNSQPYDGGCDGDGACSSTIRLKTSLDVPGSLLDFSNGNVLTQIQSLEQLVILDDDYQAIVSPLTKSPIVVYNQTAQEVLEFFSEPRNSDDWPRNSAIAYKDAQTAIAQFHVVGLLREASPNLGIPAFQTIASPLEAWLYLTRACNLACPHCFVSKDARRMGLETGLQAVEHLFKLAERHGHPKVKIKYAGGEPTMNWPLIPELHEWAKKYSSDTDIELSEVLVTNATLLSQERLQYIKDENIRLSISVDGFGAGHDRQRPARNGNPTFNRIYQSLLSALELGLSPYLIMSLTRLNMFEAPALVAFALQHRLRLNLNFYRPHQRNDPLVPNNTELTQVLRETLQIIASNLPDYNFLEGLIDRSNFAVPHRHVCGAGRNYLSIDTDGSVLPCHMLTGYNITGTPLNMLKSARFDSFSNPSIEHRNGCNTCDWRYWCGGGCPVHTEIVFGTSNISSPYCETYRAIYPELVKLQAQQLLQLKKIR